MIFVNMTDQEVLSGITGTVNALEAVAPVHQAAAAALAAAAPVATTTLKLNPTLKALQKKRAATPPVRLRMPP